VTIGNKYLRVLKVATFVLCLGPLFTLTWKALHDIPATNTIPFIAQGVDRWSLGANPIEVITHSTGKWTLTFLLLTLSVTPLRKLLGQPWLIRFRRMIGLFAFFYGFLHFITYIWLDKFFDVHEMMHDIAKRRFITVGFTAFVLMIPLAITSTSGWIRRLGGQRWHRLHQLIYASAALGVIHFFWLVKADLRRPIYYGAVLGVLLLYRIALWAVPRFVRPSVIKNSYAQD
jgi:sulfoxide reductase heme-binding subunit YedZ